MLTSWFTVPGGLVDADDTARAIMALRHLGNTEVGVESLIRAFEAKDHFRTYEGERNPSISANCNVLTCLLMMDDPTIYAQQIVKTAKFLCEQVHTDSVREKWASTFPAQRDEGEASTDKWQHINELYWMMLLSQSLATLFDTMARNPSLEASIFQLALELQEQIPMASLHVLAKVLGAQGIDGSWANGIVELTAYGVLTLSWLSHLPWIQQLGRMHGVNFITASIENGKAFLEAHKQDWKKGQYLWIEKVTYASPVLCEAYCLAAAVVPVPDFSGSIVGTNGQLLQKTNDSLFVSEGLLKGVLKAGQLISLTPLFRNLAPQLLRVAEMQACYALGFLQRKREELGIFPAREGADEKYLTFIPLTWTASNALRVQATGSHGHSHSGGLSNYILQEMMILSLLNYQVDEYMETAVERDFLGFYSGSRGSLEAVREVIGQVFKEFDHPNGTSTSRRRSIWGEADHTPTNLKIIRATLSRYVRHILLHPAVKGASKGVQGRLAKEMQTFLLAHVQHAADNIQFAASSQVQQDNHSHEEQEIGLPSPISETNDPSSPQEPPSKRRHLSTSASTSTQEQLKPKIFTPKDSRTFYSWVRTTSADHTSCPFSFTFYTCLLSHNAGNHGNGSKPWNLFNRDAKTSYVAEAMVKGLASLCRMYNDYGSVARDAGEGNLNSVNFPEFYVSGRGGSQGLGGKENGGGSFGSGGSVGGGDIGNAGNAGEGEEEKKVKEELMWIAEYERRGLERAMGEMEALVGAGEMDKVRLFVDVTDLYGHIYVVRDIGVGVGVGVQRG